MGKSSSSRRKKRSKTSSKKSRKTTKSRKLKSKKLQHRDDSLSFSDGGSSTFSSSDTEDDNRRRKHHSSTRKNGKKRAKRQSSSSEDYSRPRRKRSKKNAYDEVKKKTNSKKKRKRDLSISSYSFESRSCSTCRSESSRTIESEFDSDRGRFAKRHNKKRDLENSKSVNQYRGYRSRSCSPYGSCSQRSDYSADEEKIVEYNYNSKRLKSVIVIQGNENREHNNEERVEEITFGDSAFEEEPMIDNGRKVEVIFNSRNLELGDTEKDSKFETKGTEVPVDEKKTDFSGDTASKNDLDMELILRQKALENLKRFRGGMEQSTKTDSNQKVEGECDANNSSFGKVESCNIKFPEDGDKVIDQESLKVDNANMVCSKPCKEEDSKTIVATEAVKGFELQKGQCDSAHSSQNISDARDGGGQFKQGSSYSAVEESMDQVINKSKEKSSDQRSNEHCSPPTEPPSSVSIMSGENTSSTKPLNDSKEGSQFEQKTMSVMRGGEMVEVSYKVYIPKKAPALSRRQLKR